ncbi:hypothetical protein SI65_07359 [Aspergillus cristatus]|uniref:Uncharacterized protein n=1 Tax=Aspergillus cristatus TaxID=573508 RepID=A0A1E3B842_ASPCR|nr:hypothetical protein SI65_07359 [Aspergillus cristatus]
MSTTWMLPRGLFFRSLRQSHYTNPVSSEFLASSSFMFVNPRHHAVVPDKVAQKFPAAAIAGLSDEKALALFTCGFFSGFIFGFERWILRIGGYNLLPARYTGFQPDPQAVTIWNRSKVPSTHLLPVGSCLFGSFRMLDKHIAEPSDHSSSYVDYGFGSDEFIFAGCHRFQITRLPPSSNMDSESEPSIKGKQSMPQVQIQLQHFRCNPQKNVPSVAEYIERFHYVYAKALFANGVQSLLG